MKRSQLKNMPVIGAVLLVVLAGVAFYHIAVTEQHLSSIVTVTADVPADVPVPASSISETKVPQGSITKTDLTWAEYQTDFVKAKHLLILTIPAVSGQRIESSEVITNATSSFAVISPDERVISVSASVVGAADELPRPGDVVNVTEGGGSSSSGGASSQFDKVLCVATDATQCQYLSGAGAATSGSNASTTAGNGSAPVNVVLAVPAADADNLAGAAVNMSLNPFCRVSPQGLFISARPGKANACVVPANRDASLGGAAATTSGTATTSSTAATPSTGS